MGNLKHPVTSLINETNDDKTRYNNADGANMDHFGDVYLLVYSSGNVLW